MYGEGEKTNIYRYFGTKTSINDYSSHQQNEITKWHDLPP